MKITTLSLFVLMTCSPLFSQEAKLDTGKTTSMRIGMTSVYVSTPKEAFQFYTEILGFVEIMYQPDFNLAIVASPQDKNGTMLLLEPNDHPVAKRYQEACYKKGLPVIVFVTDNIHEEYERLSQKGVFFKKEPTVTQWGIEAIFDDQNGNWIKLHQIKQKEK
jgi:catechol 2,3-dioxygenase-like lactoylglutathione lyase family enzyme